MKVALTIWDGRISPVFDVCREARILCIDDRTVASEEQVQFDGERPASNVERLVSLGVQVLVCGAISEPLQSDLLARGIDVIPFVAGEADDVVKAYLSGNLPNHALLMPGCGRRRRFRRRRRCGRGAPESHNMN
jgi:predicted Fe-Mo cluster-binding NifX family protein